MTKCAERTDVRLRSIIQTQEVIRGHSNRSSKRLTCSATSSRILRPRKAPAVQLATQVRAPRQALRTHLEAPPVLRINVKEQKGTQAELTLITLGRVRTTPKCRIARTQVTAIKTVRSRARFVSGYLVRHCSCIMKRAISYSRTLWT